MEVSSFQHRSLFARNTTIVPMEKPRKSMFNNAGKIINLMQWLAADLFNLSKTEIMLILI